MDKELPIGVKRKIIFLEWVRGSAAAMVAVSHLLAGIPIFDHFIRNYIDPGRVGVVAFFVVSGYIIPLSFQNQSVRTFMIRRLTRLYPVYIVALTAYLLIVFRGAEWSLQWGFELFANYTMLQDLIGFAALLGPAWTLSIEWVFYGQQIAAKWAKRLEQGWVLGFFWLFVYLVFSIAERVLNRDLPTSLPMLLSVSCLGHAWALAEGKRIANKWFFALLGASAVIVPAGAYIGNDFGRLWPPLDYSLSYLGGLVWFGIAFAFRSREGLAPLVWLGKISFSLYLIHPVVTVSLDAIMDVPFWLFVIVNLAILPAVAWLTFRFIETPFKDLGRHWTPTEHRSPPGTPSRGLPPAEIPAK